MNREFRELNLRLGEWVVENRLDEILNHKETIIFKEHNMSFHDLKLFGVMGKAYIIQMDTLTRKMERSRYNLSRKRFTLRNQIRTLKSEIFRNSGIMIDEEWKNIDRCLKIMCSKV